MYAYVLISLIRDFVLLHCFTGFISEILDLEN